jgi:hypothetical protein
MKKIGVLMLIVICWNGLLRAQDRGGDILIEKNYNGLAFAEFTEAVYKDYQLQCYYFSGWTGELKIVQSETPAYLSAILTESLSGTDYHFFLHPNRQLILTLGTEIRGELLLQAPGDTLPDLSLGSRQTAGSPSAPQLEDFAAEWIIIGNPESPEQKPKVELGGYVYHADTGKPLEEAIVYVEELQTGITTDSSGYFRFDLPQGRYQLIFQSVGLKEAGLKVQLFGSGEIEMKLGELVVDMEEVVVRAGRKEHIRSVQMGIEALKMETIKQLPALLGEVDVMRSALMLPGVQTVGEFSSGINVRGGGADQNLVLLNGAPVFNASHLFGFSSSFSPDVIEGFELYKSSIPAKYGGRISSVLEIQMQEGSTENWSVRGGISPVTSRVTVEGPLAKEKASILLSGRTTYSDWILRRLKDIEFRNSRANYYDITGRFKTRLAKNDHLDVSAYLSRDAFQFNGDTTFSYQNRNVVMNYQHGFNEKLFGTFSGIFSQYRFKVSSDEDPTVGFDLAYQIQHTEGKAHFSYAPTDKHQVNFGLDLIHYQLDPGGIGPNTNESIVEARQLEQEQALEGSLYLGDEWTLSEKFSLYAGLRYVNYRFLGPKTVYNYRENAARTEENITGTTAYAPGELVQSYGGPEYRLSLRYAFDVNTSIKAAVNRNRQYLSMLFNSATVSPTATWKLSDSHIRPQTGDQFSLGVFRNLSNDQLEFSLEGYYKLIDNMVDYKAGARLLLNEHLETDVVNGDGRAYGIEALLKKNGRKLNGWLSYTYSRTFFRSVSAYPEDQINGGAWFPSAFDKPHDFSLVAFFRASQRFSFSTNLAYSTGRPITIPVAKFIYDEGVRLQYSRRNEFRVPDYFRWDLSINMEGSHKKKKPAHSSWSLSMYNVTGRKNVYSIYFVSDGTDTKGYKLSIFGRPFVTLTFNFRIGEE